MRVPTLLTMALSLVFLVGCSKPQQSNHIQIASSNNQTFLVDENRQQVFMLRNGEFVQVPLISLADFSGKKLSRFFFKEVPNFTISISTKYQSGKMYYQIIVVPDLTAEYHAYLNTVARKSKASPSELQPPGQKYAQPNWADYLKLAGNMLTVQFQDTDGFNIQTIDLNLGGYELSPRTTLVDEKGDATSVEFDGSELATASDFMRINDADVTYVLNPPP